MQIVIATLPDATFSLGRDVALAKVATLYADSAILYSPTYHGTEPFLEFGEKPLLHQLVYSMILSRDPGFVIGEDLTEAQRKKRVADASQRSGEIRQMALRYLELVESQSKLGGEHEREIADIQRSIKPYINAIGKVFGPSSDACRRAKELAFARELGLLDIQQIGERPSLYYDGAQYAKDVSEALLSNRSYGALDERFMKLHRSSSESQAAKQKVSRIASEVFQRLPMFDAATFEEIRDIKAELSKYLPAFRRGLIELSQQVKYSPWDEDFARDVDIEVTARLLPEVAGIEDAVKSNSYLSRLAYQGVKSPLTLPASTAIGAVLANSFHCHSTALVIASTLAGVGRMALEARHSWKEQQQVVEQNVFYFYYRVNRILDGK